MKTIKETVCKEIEINKSKFITLIYRIDNEAEIKSVLNNIKKEYKNANHYCYAYIINNAKRFTDDGEPSGTAGIPIMDVLEKNNLNFVFGVVVRYFGGIKLGAGGLIRAYRKSVIEALKAANIIDLELARHIKVIFDYDKQKEIEYILNNDIVQKKYDNKVTYYANVTNGEIIEKLKSINDIYIEEMNNNYIERREGE